MRTLRNTMPPGGLVRKLPAQDASRASAADASRRDLPEAPGRVIKLGPARIPTRTLTLPRN